ncbi:S41 family peptidase [Candidatus Saccharibacteria bacterium]|nr:S41 family peptidase [Candidatus Saccharibacteria bacterium]
MSKKEEVKKSAPTKKKIEDVTLGTAVFGCVITLIIGFTIGLNWTGIWDNFKPFLGFKSNSSDSLNLSSVQNLYRTLKDNYDGDLDKDALVEGAKKGLVEAIGDEYTSYMNTSEATSYRASLEGEISEAGIGVSFAKREDYIRILRTLPDNPARKAGILAGDIIFSVDDEEVWNKDAEYVMTKLRGSVGSTVKVTVVRDKEKLDFTLTREKINNVSADVTYTDNNVAILSIYRFSRDTTTLVRNLANEIKNKNVKGVVLDLRGNGGGYVNSARDIAGLWLNGEKVLIQKSRLSGDSFSYSPRGNTLFADTKTVVLINSGTASASEILVGALKDYEKATVVGTTSFGKGVMQTLLEVDGSALLKVTSAHWYTPKDNSINGTGIEPDIEIERTYDQINKGIDPQLDKALELMSSE